jgi:hypothetical protein
MSESLYNLHESLCHPGVTRLYHFVWSKNLPYSLEELRTFVIGKRVPTSHTTCYNPEGNGQVERYNGIIWKAIVTCLKSKNVLADALHLVCSLLCTATNETPHERFFGFPRRSTIGSSIPSWLLQPGPVVIKHQVRWRKHDPLVDEV